MHFMYGQPARGTELDAKVLECCLLPTLLTHIPALDIAQGGFRTSRGVLDQAFVLHTLMKR